MTLTPGLVRMFTHEQIKSEQLAVEREFMAQRAASDVRAEALGMGAREIQAAISEIYPQSL